MSLDIISRSEYIQRIERYLGKDTIIVLTGQRRVGKSFVLKDFARRKKQEGANVIYIDKESKDFDAITNSSELNQYIEDHRSPTGTNYILIDEVQDIEDFEKSVRAYRIERGCEIIITGSNAELFSSDLANRLGGRHHSIYIQSLTYQEFLIFHNLQDSDESLRIYIEAGGLPGLRNYTISDSREVAEYQKDVFNTVLLKDVILRHKVRNVSFLERLCQFAADNTGKLFSANSVSQFAKAKGESATTDLVIRYLKYLTDCYIISCVKRFDIRGKRILESNDKYYFEDHGIRNIVAGTRRDQDIEKVIENIVYQQLIHMGYEVNVGQLLAGEVDFVCTNSIKERIYVQVAYLLAHEDTIEREYGALRGIKDNYPKYIISMTPLVKRNNNEGIIHLGLREFLMSGLES